MAAFPRKYVACGYKQLNYRIHHPHQITMCLTVDSAWDAEKYTTRESTPHTSTRSVERERKKTHVEVQKIFTSN